LFNQDKLGSIDENIRRGSWVLKSKKQDVEAEGDRVRTSYRRRQRGRDIVREGQINEDLFRNKSLQNTAEDVSGVLRSSSIKVRNSLS